jgi:hypothetical protein
VKPIRHLAGRGRPEAGRFRVRLGPIPHKNRHPGMCLQPLGYGGGLSIGEQGQGPPPGEIQRVIWACASSMYQVSRWSDAVLGKA